MHADVASIIDHTCLKPDAVTADIDQLCAEAVDHGFRCVCVAPTWVEHAAGRVADTGVRVCTVIGFPHGNTLSVIKGVAAETVLNIGATEIDMVMQIGRLKDGDVQAVGSDIALVADFVHRSPSGILKVIIETPMLTDDEIVTACRLAEASGADFVKTSTGFAGAAASVDTVKLMRSSVTDRVGVKAAGGIRDIETARAMIAAGATRIGSSASVAIVTPE